VADVLIIDDDPDAAAVLAEIMEAQGHVVRVGYNGEEGLRLVHQRIPDVALLDVEMPLLSGPAMAYRMMLRDMGLESIPIVLLSGAVGLDKVAAQVGTPYFMSKPARYGPVVALVARALRERVAPHHVAP
jgi:DNA-binding NtrC family response regulator